MFDFYVVFSFWHVIYFFTFMEVKVQHYDPSACDLEDSYREV